MLTAALCPWRYLAADEPPRAWSLHSQDIRLLGDASQTWVAAGQRYVLLEGSAMVEQGLLRLRADTLLARFPENADKLPIKSVTIVGQGRARAEGAGRNNAERPELADYLETKSRIIPPTNARSVSAAQHPLVARVDESARSQQAASFAPPTSANSESDVADATYRTNKPNEQGDILRTQAIDAPPSPDANPFPMPNENRATPTIRDGASSRGLAGNLGGGGLKRIRWFPRTSQPFNVSSSLSADGLYRQWMFTGGINLIVEEVGTGATVDITADRAVLWTRGDLGGDPTGGGLQSDGSQEVEVYLEGNVNIRQGNPTQATGVMSIVLFGKQVYFNINTNQALVLDGAVEAVEPQLQVPVYMTSPEIRQLAPGEFFGRDASFTTSIHRGTPGYAIKGKEIYFEEIKERIKNPFTGQPVIDSDTGQPLEVARHYATGYANTLRVSDVPVFFWPYVRANAEDPLGPVQNIRLGQSQNLGTIAGVSLDIWQLTGFDYLPIADRTNWLLDLGYFSDRGFSAGSRFNYFGRELFSPDDKYFGRMLGWYLNDNGFDQLGPTRRGIVPSTSNRGRYLFQNRYDLREDTTVITEFSYLSDSNVLESFFEAEYDTGKDQETLVYGKFARDNYAFTGIVQPRLREFLPQNEWLPRADAYWIGQPLFGDRVTYFTHSSVGYGRLNTPQNYVLPTDVSFDLGRGDTRHEFNLPLSLGPWEVTPFVIGQATGYTDAIDAEGLGRLYGAAGVRTSLPFYRIFPNVKSDLFYLNGLAHKVSLNADYLFARTGHHYSELPLMDQLDDDTSELVRRQNILNSFGGVVPTWYEPRFQALRRGIIFYPEALDNQDTLRLSVTQRLQTKRGPEGRRRIIDWMYFDSGATLFPAPNRDNLGESWGLIDYTYKWNIGDRTSITSDGLYEPYDGTLQIGGGIFTQRPPRGTFSIFYSHFDSGPFTSNYIGVGTAYRFSNRYAGYFEIGNDLEAANAVNVRASFSRIGLDFVTTLGIFWNAGRDDLGFDFSILPRVGIRGRLNRSIVQTLPFGVEPAAQYGPSAMQRQSIINSDPNF
jgi:hypothetical protein